MNLNKRLVLANASTVVIPLLITVLIALASFYIANKIWGMNISLENYQKLSQIKFELLELESNILQRSPETVEEEGFRNYLQERLAAFNGEFVISKDERVLYSSRSFSKIDMAKLLEAGKSPGRREAVQIGDFSYTVQIIDLVYKNSSRGSVMLMAPVSRSEKTLNVILGLIGVSFLLSFVLTNVIISYQFSRSMVRPLRNLRQAAEEISRGNLEQPIVEEGEEEIRALCRDLERMRLKLKESVHTQLKYEDNRKILISSISHDLKTPVTSIKGYVEGILDGIADTPEKVERYLKTIQAKAGQVDQMIEDLLLYAKLDLNQLPFDFERTDLGEYLTFFSSECEPELERESIRISFRSELNRQSPYVLLDRQRMKRVLMNIVDNARKYMGKDQGEIKIFLRETPASLIMELRDNGSGVKEEDLPFIFDRFYRSDEARRKGSGLGLAIAKQIIEGHQGKIWAISHREEGTSIMISLSKHDTGGQIHDAGGEL